MVRAIALAAILSEIVHLSLKFQPHYSTEATQARMTHYLEHGAQTMKCLWDLHTPIDF